ncbi:MAG TPA: beta-ketoacyl synthase N-terminal-like domain-containing protein [Anaerolineales bacterium]|nr:beta-ketoacyl synthase N-terminal-like domain-containing protein [Anaerolineales bacterium]
MPRSKSLPRGVAVVGAGMSKFGTFAEKNSRDLFVEAFKDLKKSVDKGLDPPVIESLYIGNFSSDQFEHQAHIAPLLADSIGLTPRPATRVEDACASGGAAIRQGVMAIASGMYDVVLVGGAEKMTALNTAAVTEALGTAADMPFEIPAGFTFPGFYAAMASAYMHRYGMRPEHLMNVAIKNHDNAALNPNAQFGVTIQKWMEGRIAAAIKKGKPAPGWSTIWDFLHDESGNPMVAWPLRLFDCSPVTDGAAAVLLVAEERAYEFTDHPIHIIGSGQASDSALHDRPELTAIPAAKIASSKAYEMAGVTADDIRIAEVHDCFTIAEIIATEDLGFFVPGEGFKAAEDGMTARHGAKPVNTSGGLKAKGHPVGASGVAQAVEIWRQMRGQAGERQVPGDVPLALTHNVGATGSTCVVHIYERRN